MIGCGLATDVTASIMLRFVVGLGIGAILASMAAINPECAPTRCRIFSVALLQAGYLIGAMMAGLVVNALLPDHGWRVLMSAAGVAILLPLASVLLPESLEFLEKRQPRRALARINTIRSRLGRSPYGSFCVGTGWTGSRRAEWSETTIMTTITALGDCASVRYGASPERVVGANGERTEQASLPCKAMKLFMANLLMRRAVSTESALRVLLPIPLPISGRFMRSNPIWSVVRPGNCRQFDPCSVKPQSGAHG